MNKTHNEIYKKEYIKLELLKVILRNDTLIEGCQTQARIKETDLEIQLGVLAHNLMLEVITNESAV